MLIRVETEGRNIAERANRAQTVRAQISLAELFGCVLDDFQPVSACNIHHGIHVYREAVDMNRHDCFGVRRDAVFNLRRIEVPRQSVAINDDRRRTGSDNRRGAGNDRKGGKYNFVARTDSERNDC